MEARLVRIALLAVSVLALGAGYRTENFIVTAPTEQLAREVAEAGETYRRELAIEWLGHELPPWRDKCPITVHAGPQLGAGGVTQFMFENGQPFGWTMSIQGSRERILDSVLPHEITHTIFATHFGRPLPRWADEGACTTVEHDSEKSKQHRLLYEFLTTGRGIAFNHMFAMREYPSDILPLYAQGFSLARFLIHQGGKQKFVAYVGDGMRWNNWTRATQQHYGFHSLSELQVTWLDWVRNGSRPLPAENALVAAPAAPSGDELATVKTAGFQTPADVLDEVSSAALDVPAATVAVNTAAKGGWYARVRDETRANREAGVAPLAAADNGSIVPISARDTARDNARDTAPEQAVSRPQPIGRPRQVILEWTQPPSSAKATAPRSYLVSPDVVKGTILR